MKISVLTPSYNSGKYLERAIQSVLNQNYPNFEHIVFDCVSKDDTISILKKYSHIQWTSEPDFGQSDAMNKCFKACTGDIVVYLNADDEFNPGAFNEIIKLFTQNPKADMVVGSLISSDLDGTEVRTPSIKYYKLIQYWLGMHPNNPVSYFYKRDVQIKIGDFPLEDHYAMDIWFLLKAYHKFKLVQTDKVLGIFHSDGTNKTANTEVGINMHNAVKSHLIKDNKKMLLYFYGKLIHAKYLKK